MDWRWFVRGLMYLNEDFEGGDFYFTDENMESQVSKICNFFLTLYNWFLFSAAVSSMCNGIIIHCGP